MNRIGMLALAVSCAVGCQPLDPNRGVDGGLTTPDGGRESPDSGPPDSGQVPPDGGCTLDSQCSGGTICQQCNRTCTFQPGASCSSQAPCPCEYACIFGRCQANANVPAASCVWDRDCPVDQFCNRPLFQCQRPMWVSQPSAGTCATNADCREGTVCSTANAADGGTFKECLTNQTFTCRTYLECPNMGTGWNCTAERQCIRRGC